MDERWRRQTNQSAGCRRERNQEKLIVVGNCEVSNPKRFPEKKTNWSKWEFWPFDVTVLLLSEESRTKREEKTEKIDTI